MEFTFTVGETESHDVRFLYSNRLSSSVCIYVDSELVTKDVFRIWIPDSRHYEFKVGDAERHDVVIEVTFPRIGTIFRNADCGIFIDGEFITRY